MPPAINSLRANFDVFMNPLSPFPALDFCFFVVNVKLGNSCLVRIMLWALRDEAQNVPNLDVMPACVKLVHTGSSKDAWFLRQTEGIVMSPALCRTIYHPRRRIHFFVEGYESLLFLLLPRKSTSYSI